MTTPDQVRDAAIEAMSDATEQHHIVTGQTDANGNNPCVCDQWWDSDSMPGWDEHMAEVAYDAVLPILRRALAEEAAQAIETLYDQVRHDASERVTAADCAAKVRQMGGSL